MTKRLRIFPEPPEEPGQATGEAGKVGEPREGDAIAFLQSEWARSRQALETLRSQLHEQEQAMQAVTAHLRAKDETVQTLTRQLQETAQTAQSLADQLESITRSKAWRVALLLRRLRPWLAPRGSLRERSARAGLHLARRVRAKGVTGLLRAALRRWRHWTQQLARVPAQAFAPPGPTLAHMIERARASKGAVIFLPSIGWKVHLFQRPHHLAREFARQGWLAIFDCSNAADAVNGFAEIEPNLFLYRGPQAVLQQLPAPWLWTFPYNFEQTDAFPPGARTVYDWIDDLDVFTHDRALLERNHRRALREADVVASVAGRLHEQALAVRPDALYLPNAVEFARFAGAAAPVPADPAVARLRREGKPVAGYYGALAAWFDYDLLDAVAGLRPNWNFVLIGPRYDDSLEGQAVLQRSNVVWLGPRDYPTLPGYLQFFDVALIPFRLNDITRATSPLKLYEYFAGGKPVITTPMPECQAFPEVRIVRTAVEFAEALDQARAQGSEPEFRDRLRALARANSWTERVQRLEHHFQQAPPTEDVREALPDERAVAVARRFQHLRNRRNQPFFAMLSRHFADLCDNPCLSMYFEYALTTNERGRAVAELLSRKACLSGKRVLDVGCAYGGFLVAFAEQGAEAAGIDINEALLALASANLRANGLGAALLRCDITQPEELAKLPGPFDLVTCNDVIEHVLDPAAALRHIATLLPEGGLAYFEIPNRYFPRFVLRDGHYQLFGITLLERDEAAAYHAAHAPGVGYDVGHYLEIEAYQDLFNQAGLELEILEETYTSLDCASVLKDVAELRSHAPAGLATVPESLRESVAERLARYLDEIEHAPRLSPADRQAFLIRYGASFWRVVGRKKAAVLPDVVPAAAETAATPAPEPLPPGDPYSGLTLLPHLDRQQQATILDQRPLAAPLRGPDVVCFSIIDWSFRYQRPQQLMSQFAAQGQRVFYINLTEFLPVDAVPRFRLRQLKTNVYEVLLAAQRPPKIYGERVEGIELEALLASLDDLRRSEGLHEVIGYVMIASWTEAALAARTRWHWRIVYDCMDEWENFPGISRAIVESEDRLVRNCDLLVVTAQRLYDKWRSHDRPMVLARNAADYAFYAEHCHPNSLLSELEHPIAGYYGAIADWFDLELLEYVAVRRPDCTFVLLGGVFDVDVSRLQALPNVRLLGQQPYAAMPQYLFHFDVCLIPFKINPITEATDPVKLYEYLSGGKPVVSVALPEVEPYRDYLYIAADAADFVAKLDAALAEDDPELPERRRALARQHTWQERWQRIDERLRGLAPRASIVVITYNNLALTRLCLESILRNTDYPNYEVIVVDNHSADGTPAYLRYLAQQHPRIRVILNADNHGFARANNQGLTMATGEYLVLLNNDTIVPAGWLSRLLRHLDDPQVGLVGPVTNFVGNEARIAVTYQTRAEMETFANRHVWDHDGEAADIHMLAMYCVALRRETYERLGPLDEQFGIGMFEDDDYSMRARQQGLRVLCALDVFVHHFGQAAFGKLIETGEYNPLFEENRRRFEAKWQLRWVPHQHAPLQWRPRHAA